MYVEVFNTLSGESWQAPLLAKDVLIGRSETGQSIDWNDDNAIDLQSRLVSRQHAVLQRKSDSWCIEHIGTNETTVNDRILAIDEVVNLDAGDDIRIGEFILSLSDDQVAEGDGLECVFGVAEITELEQQLHARLLQLMEMRQAQTSIDLSDLAIQKKIAGFLDRLIEEAYSHLDAKAQKEIARVAMYRRINRAITAVVGSDSDPCTATIRDAGGESWEESISVFQRKIAANLGLSFDPKSMEQDCNNLDSGYLRAFDQNALDLSSGLVKVLGGSYLRINVLDLIYGFGPLQDLIDMDSISEIMVISREKIFVEKFGVVEDSRRSFFSDEILLSIIQRIVSPIGRRIDKSSPMVDAHLPDGSRVNAIIAPLALKGPCLTIRKFSETPLVIDDLVGFGALSERMAAFLRSCVRGRKNVIVSGGTGSGKTTLLNCLSAFIPAKERVVTIEDTAELQLKQSHVVTLEARPPNLEGKGAVTMRDLVKNSLRMRPDRIVVGECRGGETLDMLQAMNTGHDGSMTTAHANNPEDLMRRLETMVLFGTDMPIPAIRDQIASAVDVVVQLNRFSDGARRITSIAEITGVDEQTGAVLVEQVFGFQIEETSGKFIHTGYMPKFTQELLTNGLMDLSAFFGD